MGLGVRLKELRIAKGESLQQTADAVKTSKAHVWQMERGQADNPAIGVLKKLADHFNVSVAYLIGEQMDADDAEAELAGMFRQASEFTEDERAMLKSMMKTLAETSAKKKASNI
jgi:transcriptional regulator with XRE-family HTH domain